MEEWNSSRSFTERVANLRSGTGDVLDGTDVKLIKGIIVMDDGDDDLLAGLAERDWLLFGEEDQLRAVGPGDEFN